MAPVTIQPLYTATATSHGGRNGRVRSVDGVIDMALTMPKGLGGPGPGLHQPRAALRRGLFGVLRGRAAPGGRADEEAARRTPHHGQGDHRQDAGRAATGWRWSSMASSRACRRPRPMS